MEPSFSYADYILFILYLTWFNYQNYRKMYRDNSPWPPGVQTLSSLPTGNHDCYQDFKSQIKSPQTELLHIKTSVDTEGINDLLFALSSESVE